MNDLFHLTQALGWTLTHMIWQGTFVALAAGVALALLRQGSARSRYALLLGSMTILALAAVSTFTAHYSQPIDTLNSVIGAAQATPLPILSNTGQAASPATAAGLDLVLRLNRYMTPAVALWSVCVALLLCRLIGGLTYIQRLKRLDLHPVPQRLRAEFEALCDQMAVTSTPALFESARAAVPMAVGYFKPVVLLPLGAVTHLPADQLEAVLRHELAHIKRADCLVNLFQTLMETLFFYHPAVWWLSQKIREEREHCCDDMALHHHTQPITLARALTNLQEVTMNPNHLAMAATGRKGGLSARIHRLVTNPRLKPSVLEFALVFAAVVLMSSTILTHATAPNSQELTNPTAPTAIINVTPHSGSEPQALSSMPTPPEPTAQPRPAAAPKPELQSSPEAQPEPPTQPTPAVTQEAPLEPTPEINPKPTAQPAPEAAPRSQRQPTPVTAPEPRSEPQPRTPRHTRVSPRTEAAHARELEQAHHQSRAAHQHEREAAIRAQINHSERAKMERDIERLRHREAELVARHEERNNRQQARMAEMAAYQRSLSAQANQQAANQQNANQNTIDEEALANHMKELAQIQTEMAAVQQEIADSQATLAAVQTDKHRNLHDKLIGGFHRTLQKLHNALEHQHHKLTAAHNRLEASHQHLAEREQDLIDSERKLDDVTKALRKHLMADGLIEAGASFDFELNTTDDAPGFYLNGEKQSEALFRQYLNIYAQFIDGPVDRGMRARIVQ